MKKYIYILAMLGIWSWFPTGNAIEKEHSSDTLIKEPVFKDGQGFYSYKKPLDLELPKDGKVLIQYFYQYGCEICLNADDYLKAYANRNADKVVLQRSPSFLGGSEFTAKMNAAFTTYGRKELSDKYLFDSADKLVRTSLIEDNEAIKNWLVKNDVNIPEFYQVFSSPEIEQNVVQDRDLYQKYYSPPRSPMAVLNGKYILISDTLYNDDYTYAVLDFLVDKLQKEKEK